MKTGNSISAHNVKVMRRQSENVRGKTKQYTFLAPKTSPNIGQIQSCMNILQISRTNIIILVYENVM